MAERNDLESCPHSGDTYSHRWHGLPLKGCGGSHLSLDEAKKTAKPFEGSDEKYPAKGSSHANLDLPDWISLMHWNQ